MSILNFQLVIPTYNEALVIEPTLREVCDVLSRLEGIVYHVVVADNGSSDGTPHIVRQLQFPQVRLVSVPDRGKGIAIIHVARIHGHEADIFGFCDADLSADPRALGDMIESIRKGADVVIGSRLLDTRSVDRSFLRTGSSQIFNMLRQWILGIRVKDSQCGLKVFGRRGLEILKQCEEKGWFFDMELLARAEREGHLIHEVPVAWTEFRYAHRKSKLNVVRDGVKSIQAMIRIRRRIHDGSRV